MGLISGEGESYNRPKDLFVIELIRNKFMCFPYNGLKLSSSLVKKPPGSWRDLGGIPPGFPPGPAEILAAGISVPRRDSRRDLGGILAGLPPGSRRDFGRQDFASRREHWRDRPPRFWPPSFRSPPSIPAGSWRDYHRDPAEILAAGISLRAESASGLARRDFGRRVFAPRRESRWDLGGITTGIPPRFWPPGFRFARRIPAGTWRELLPRFWPPGFCFLPRIPSGSWWAHSPRFWSPRFPFLAENLAKIPPRFSARQD